MSLAPGHMLAGKYRIESEVGSGGMGTVYRAQHTTLRRTVAIKVMHRHLSEDAACRTRFEREARAAAALSGHACAQILDVDRRDDGTPYLVMEFLEGETLDEIVTRDGPMAFAEVVRCAKQICVALGEAHGKGIVHRDLKPGNVMRTRSGEVKVLDFGLALGLPSGPLSRSDAGHDNRLLGTPFFIAPEQIVSASNVDARADIWALGATLFFLLTGRPPFMASNLYLITARILGGDAPSVAELRGDVPQALAAVVAACLVRDPDGRLRSMDEVEAALDGRLVLEPPPATIPTSMSIAKGVTSGIDPHTAVTETIDPRTRRSGP